MCVRGVVCMRCDSCLVNSISIYLQEIINDMHSCSLATNLEYHGVDQSGHWIILHCYVQQVKTIRELLIRWLIWGNDASVLINDKGTILGKAWHTTLGVVHDAWNAVQNTVVLGAIGVSGNNLFNYRWGWKWLKNFERQTTKLLTFS